MTTVITRISAPLVVAALLTTGCAASTSMTEPAVPAATQTTSASPASPVPTAVKHATASHTPSRRVTVKPALAPATPAAPKPRVTTAPVARVTVKPAAAQSPRVAVVRVAPTARPTTPVARMTPKPSAVVKPRTTSFVVRVAPKPKVTVKPIAPQSRTAAAAAVARMTPKPVATPTSVVRKPPVVRVAPKPVAPTRTAAPVVRKVVAKAPVKVVESPAARCQRIWKLASARLTPPAQASLQCGRTVSGFPGVTAVSYLDNAGSRTIYSLTVTLDPALIADYDDATAVALGVHEIMHARVWVASSSQRAAVYRILGTTESGFRAGAYYSRPTERLSSAAFRCLGSAGAQPQYATYSCSTLQQVLRIV